MAPAPIRFCIQGTSGSSIRPVEKIPPRRISTASAGLTANGSFASLAAGATDGSSLVVGMNTSSAGLKNGTATVALASDGSYNNGVTTALPSQTIGVTGAVYQEAQASVLPASPIALGNTRIGGTLNQTLTISNSAPGTGGYTETLGASFGSVGSGLSGNGSLTGLAANAGPSNALSVGFTAGAAGAYAGAATVDFDSEAINNSGLGNLAVGSQTVDFVGTVDAVADLKLTSGGGYSFTSANANSGVLNFGDITLGDGTVQDALDLFNNVSGPADFLVGSVDDGNLNGSPFSLTGSGSSFDLGAGAGASYDISFNTNAATGSFTETLVIDDASHNGSQSDLSLAQYDLTIEGTIVQPGQAGVPDAGSTSLLLGLGVLAVVLVSRRRLAALANR